MKPTCEIFEKFGVGCLCKKYNAVVITWEDAGLPDPREIRLDQLEQKLFQCLVPVVPYKNC